MEEPIILDPVNVSLVSVILPNGMTIPSPLIVLKDETPLYEDSVIEEIELAAREERNPEVLLDIVELQQVNPDYINVVLASDLLKKMYTVKIPRPLLQVGRMYNTILKAPALCIATASELADEEGEVMNVFSEDIIFKIRFLSEMTPDQNIAFNTLLNHSNHDFFDNVDKSDLTNLASQTSVTLHPEEYNKVRGDILDIVLSLINGSEDALVSLYEYAENIDTANETMKKNEVFTPEDRLALIAGELIKALYYNTTPATLISHITEEEEIDSINDFQEVINTSGKDLEQIFSSVMKEHLEEHPEPLKINEDSSDQEKMDYLSRPTNTIPLLGGLFALSDRINIDLLYSRNWNSLSDITEDDYVSVGELTIILALVVAQRIQMFSKVVGNNTPEETTSLAMSVIVSILTRDNEDQIWALEEGLYRMSATQPLVFNEFLHIAVEDESKNEVLSGPFGGLMHWLGHAIIKEGWTQEAMNIAFENQPIILEFVEALFDEHSEWTDEETDGCYSYNAMARVVEEGEDEDEEVDVKPLIKELGEALTILAELNVMKAEDFQKDSEEWKESIRAYMSTIIN